MLTRGVVITVGGKGNLVFGQHIGFNPHRLLAGGVPQADLDGVIAVIHFRSQLEIGPGCAKFRCGQRLTKNAVALPVTDRNAQFAPGIGGQVKGGQRQRAQVDHLPGLVNGLVGGHQHAPVAVHTDGAFHPVAAQLRSGLHNNRTPFGLTGGHIKFDGSIPTTVGDAGVNLLLTAVFCNQHGTHGSTFHRHM